MSYIVVDVEADGPIPGDYSMVAIGAVIVDKRLDKKFYGKLKPISDKWRPQALQVSGFSREETQQFDDPVEVMISFENWMKENCVGRPFFISDNNGFDFAFVSWYFWHFLDRNPFGHSSTNLGSLYKGLVKSVFKNFTHLRKTKHTHHPVDDALGNAEALLAIHEMGVKMYVGEADGVKRKEYQAWE